MSEKRNWQQLTPPSPQSESISKKPNRNMTSADLSVKQLTELLLTKMEGLDAKFDNKIQNLATKDDLRQYAIDVQNIKESNEAIKVTLAELKTDRDTYRRKFDQLDQLMRNKNIIIKGVHANNNLSKSIKDLFAQQMNIKTEMDIDVLKIINSKNNILLVKFTKEDSVAQIFRNIKNLAGTGIIIERDYPLEIRMKTKKLLKIRKMIKTNLTDRQDKAIVIKVFGDRMFINNHQFQWNDCKLWYGAVPAIIKLNTIFKYQFDDSFFNEIDYDEMQQ